MVDILAEKPNFELACGCRAYGAFSKLTIFELANEDAYSAMQECQHGIFDQFSIVLPISVLSYTFCSSALQPPISDV
jgi:hypothetical protein